MLLVRNISHADRHLAVVDLAETSTPLPCDADRFAPRFMKTRGIKHDHSVLFAQLRAHLAHQLVAQWLVIPIRPPDKPLQPHALLAKAIGNRFGILALKVREQALHERAGMRALLLADQVFSKRFHKPLQPRQHPCKNLRCHRTFIQQLLLACFVFRFHANAPSVKHPLVKHHGSC